MATFGASCFQAASMPLSPPSMSDAVTRATVTPRSVCKVYIAPATWAGILKKLNARLSTTPMMRSGGG